MCLMVHHSIFHFRIDHTLLSLRARGRAGSSVSTWCRASDRLSHSGPTPISATTAPRILATSQVLCATFLYPERGPDLKTWRGRCIYISTCKLQKYPLNCCYFINTTIRNSSYLCVLNLCASFPAPSLSHIPFAGDTKTTTLYHPRMYAWRHSGERTLDDNWKEVKSVAFLSSGEIVLLLLVTELCDVSLSAPGGGKETQRCASSRAMQCGGQHAFFL